MSSGAAAAAAAADIAGTMTRGGRCRRMLQEGSSIEIAAVISGHIAAAPNRANGLCLEPPAPSVLRPGGGARGLGGRRERFALVELTFSS